MSLCRNRHLLGRKVLFHSMPPRSRIAILLQRRSLHLRSRAWILQLGHCPCRLFVKNKADQFQSIFNHFKRRNQGKSHVQFGSFPISKARKFRIPSRAIFAASIVFDKLSIRRFRPNTTGPSYCDARDIYSLPNCRSRGTPLCVESGQR